MLSVSCRAVFAVAGISNFVKLPGNDYASLMDALGESRPTAAIPMENPYCSCKPTRVRSRPGNIGPVSISVDARCFGFR